MPGLAKVSDTWQQVFRHTWCSAEWPLLHPVTQGVRCSFAHLGCGVVSRVLSSSPRPGHLLFPTPRAARKEIANQGRSEKLRF